MTQQERIIGLEKDIENLKKQVEEQNNSFSRFESQVQANLDDLRGYLDATLSTVPRKS